jgi:hypothetical protein
MDDALTDPAGPAVERLNVTSMQELWFSPHADLAGVWTLRQAGQTVGVVTRAPLAPSLRLSGETWATELRTGPTGWSAVFRRDDGYGAALSYHPRFVRGGGDFRSEGAVRYRLRSQILGGQWSLVDEAGHELARSSRFDFKRMELRFRLGEAAATDMRSGVLLLASCLAIVWDQFAPKGGGGGGGG